MIRRAFVAAAALVLLFMAMVPAGAAGSRLCTVDDPRLPEISGVAARAGAPRFVVQNDSGDSARFFAADTRTGTAAVHTVPGTRNVDWDDQPIISAPLPRAVRLAPTTAPSRSSNPSSGPAPGRGSSGSGIGWGLIAIVAAAVLAFVLGSRLRRRGRHKDQGGEDLSWTG